MESRVLLVNYACVDARVLSNTSAIIIETIEKTMPDGSIIRGGNLIRTAPASLTAKHEETFGDIAPLPPYFLVPLSHQAVNNVFGSVQQMFGRGRWRRSCQFHQVSGLQDPPHLPGTW